MDSHRSTGLGDAWALGPRRRPTTRRKRLSALAAVTAFFTLSAVGIAWADQVVNDLDSSVDTNLEQMNLTVGGPSGTVRFWLNPTTNDDGKPGCNLGGPGSQLVLTVSSANPSVAGVSGGPVTITACSNPSASTFVYSNPITVTPVGAGSTTVSLAFSSVTTNSGATNASDYPVETATFTVNVTAADTTSPTVTIAQVTGTGITPSDTTSPFSVYTNNGTSITWSANEAGTYAIKIGADCSTGTVPSDGTNLSGSYPAANTSVTSSISNTGLGTDGSKTVWVCVTDASTNTGGASATVTKDTQAPNAPTPNVSPSPNADGWNNTSPVTVSFTDNGDNGPSGVASCTASQTVTGNTAGTVKSGTCTDNAGNESASASVMVKIDTDAPNPPIASVSPTPNAAGWNNTQPVVVSYSSAGDNGPSGVKSCTADQTFTTETTASGTATSGTCTDYAGNTSSARSVTVKIDLTDPSVAITAPADGLTTIADAITVSGTASDTPSGLKSVTVNGVAAGNANNWTTASNTVQLECGANTITATATDNADRTGAASITVTRLCFTLQYLRPIDQSTTTPIVNTGKYGRVIPVKVIVSLLGGGALNDADLNAYGLTLRMGVNSANCADGAASDSLEAYADAGSSSAGTNTFRWDPVAQQWIYNLDTKAPPGVAMQINSCYRLDVYVSDGTNKVKISTSPYALFKPTK